MKVILQVFLSTIIVANLFAQNSIIPNSSFENWSGKFPDSLRFDTGDVNIGIINFSTESSDGSKALFLGSTLSSTSQFGIRGARCEVYDTLDQNEIEKVKTLTFDYKVKNNNSSFMNGLTVYIYFYDENDGYLNKFEWSSPMLANNDDFISVSKQVYLSEDVFTYHLTYEYVNLGGSKDEFAILDNVQLSLSQPNSVFENINDVDVIVYPNPVVDKLNIENSSFKINSISIFNLEGKEVFNIIETNEESKEIDLGHLKSGIYYLKLKNKKQHKTIKFNKY